MDNPIKMDDLGGKNTTIFGSTSNFSTSTFNGEAKLIVLLRNPIGRAVSHHNHDLSKSGSPEWLLAATVQFLMKHLIEIEIMELLIFFLWKRGSQCCGENDAIKFCWGLMEATTGHQVPRQMNETGWLLKFFYGVVEFFFFP